MSHTTMYVISRDGTVGPGYTYDNAFHGAFLIWVSMGERYGKPFPFGINMDKMKQWWSEMSNNLDIPYHDRVTLGSTYDRTIVKGNNLPRLYECFKKSAEWLPEDCHIHKMLPDLEFLISRGECGGVCWRQTSVIPNPWISIIPEEELLNQKDLVEGDEEVWYNINQSDNHQELFDVTPPSTNVLVKS